MTKPKRIPYEATVTNVMTVSPSIRRVTLKSSNTEQFTSESKGGYFKFVFTESGETDITGLTEEQKTVLRTYTIRDYEDTTGEITVDLVLHLTNDHNCGFASRWAESVSVGDTISLVGPGKSPYPDFTHDAVFFVADMTALPALSVALAQIPSDARGHAVIEVATEKDIQSLNHPDGVKLSWVISDQNQSLTSTVRQMPWPEGIVDVWCACEFDMMKSLRQYFRNERQVGKDHIYISSYWKNGVSEDGHKVIKRQDLQNESS
ncbi:siderophore-interacting protein [Vibrio salinus]|uniref:siderophore-interacting protein n=1 Tax=Vibrio salinus TaxID=2899784 RepID=UPI001E398611|nr:siderophore-interacting protein [Vibrio salinus]MCE0495623.1 siderophore-interacting protein [Vibrio salinus]